MSFDQPHRMVVDEAHDVPPNLTDPEIAAYLRLSVGAAPPRNVSKREIRAGLELLDAVRAMTLTPPTLARLTDAVRDLLTRCLVAPREVVASEIAALIRFLEAGEEWRRELHGYDPMCVQRDQMVVLLTALLDEWIQPQIAGGSAQEGATLVYESGMPGGMLPPVPEETAKDRRKRIIAANLTRFREARDLSKNALARAIEVDRGSVKRWEIAEWEPSPEHLERLADVLGVPVHEFYREPIAAPASG